MPNDKSIKVIAELVTSPIGEGVSLSKFVKKAVEVIDSTRHVRIQHHPMGTIIEADDVDTILAITKKAHEAIFDAGASRVVTRLVIDDRRDKMRKMEDKVEALK